MKKILFLAVIIFTALSFLIFHDTGNKILKPYLSSYLEHKLKQKISVEVLDLKIDFDYLEFSALLNKDIKLNTEGNLSLFTQKENLHYTLKSDDFKNKIDINGTLIGTFNDIKVQGEGVILQSYINYDLNLKDDVIKNIKVNINQADIAALLKLLSKPPYAKGKVDINIESTEKGIIKSDFATLEFSNASYDIKAEKFLSNYLLIIPKLSKVLFLSKKKLNGKLIVEGEMKLKSKNINIIGNSKSLGGKTSFDYNGKSLNTFMDNVEISKLLYLLNEKPYAIGEMDANIKLSDLEQLRGSFELNTKNAKTINHVLKKELALDFGKPIPFSLESTGDIAQNMLNIQSKLSSNIFTYTSNNLQYNLNTSTFNNNYQLEIPKLSKLNTLVGKSLRGKLTINGEINYQKNLIITGFSKNLEGSIDFKLAEKKLNATIKNISVEKLMYLLTYPQVFNANLLGKCDYDFATHKGSFTSTLNNARLLSSELTLSIKQLRGLDLTKERYNESYFNASLNKDLIDIKFEAKNKNVLLAIPSGRINKSDNSINATFNISIDNKDIAGKIQGNTSDPRIVINSSKFIKDEMQNMMQGNMPDQAFKELGLGDKESNMMRDFMDSFF